jgi:hypothetical protein
MIFFSILADLGREAMEAFVHANAITYRVPFAAIMGSDKYADTADNPFKTQGNGRTIRGADEAFTAYFLKADFGNTGTNWESLAATVPGLKSILRAEKWANWALNESITCSRSQ